MEKRKEKSELKKQVLIKWREKINKNVNSYVEKSEKGVSTLTDGFLAMVYVDLRDSIDEVLKEIE